MLGQNHRIISQDCYKLVLADPRSSYILRIIKHARRKRDRGSKDLAFRDSSNSSKTATAFVRDSSLLLKAPESARVFEVLTPRCDLDQEGAMSNSSISHLQISFQSSKICKFLFRFIEYIDSEGTPVEMVSMF